jgi:hypothetical protein
MRAKLTMDNTTALAAITGEHDAGRCIPHSFSPPREHSLDICRGSFVLRHQRRIEQEANEEFAMRDDYDYSLHIA